jgi:hypothetical protein
MNYKLMDWYLKLQDRILTMIIIFGVVFLLLLSFLVRADTFPDLYDNPYGIGKDIEKEKRTITKHEFTAYTEKTEYSDGTGNIIISSGQIFADSSGTRIENAKSLKDCEFCDGLKMNINLDPLFNISIEDWNYTDFKNVCLFTKEKGEIPLKINLIENKTIKEKDIKINKSKDKSDKWDCYNFTVPKSVLDYEIEWGWNSTTVQFVYIYYTSTQWSSISDTNCNGVGTNIWGMGALDIGYYSSGTGQKTKLFLGFNTSTLGITANVTSALFMTKIGAENLEGDETWTADVWTCNFGDNLTISDYTNVGIQNQGTLYTASNVVGDYSTISINVSHINTTAITQICVFPTAACNDNSDYIRLDNSIGSVNLTIVYDLLSDTTPLFSTIPYNSTTTNQSAVITWTPSESANYTLRYTTTADYTGGTLISNATSLSTQRDVSISPLVNYTQYYINVSIWDTSGNYNQSNFSFRTNQNAANSCATCTIACSDNCVLTSNIDCAAGTAIISGAGTLTGERYLTNWKTMYINGGCTVYY